MHPEPITDLELDAYIDGELDPGRCLAIEEHLAANPDAAARLMTDLSLRTALRLSQPVLSDRPDLTAAAARLGQKLGSAGNSPARLFNSRKWIGGLATAAAMVAVLVLIPDAPVARANPPAFVSDAVESYRTGLLRATMPSQIEAPHFDAKDTQRFTRIRLPTLPVGWQVTDVQLFPSDEGPALQVMVRTPGRQAVSIFAVRTSARAPDRPVTVREGQTTVAYWRHGDIAYALTGIKGSAALDLAAQDLADNRLG